MNIISVPHTNTLIAKGTERDLDYIEELIKSIDQPISQVMIEARIVEADANFTRDIGIRWGGAAAFGNTHAPFAGTVRGGVPELPGLPRIIMPSICPLATTSTAFGGLGFCLCLNQFKHRCSNPGHGTTGPGENHFFSQGPDP